MELDNKTYHDIHSNPFWESVLISKGQAAFVKATIDLMGFRKWYHPHIIKAFPNFKLCRKKLWTTPSWPLLTLGL